MKIKEQINKVILFVRRAIQTTPGTEDEAQTSIFARFIRVINLLLRGYFDDDLTIHAASLTFVTLTSLVPVLAVVFALARGFGIGADQITAFQQMDWLQNMPEQFQQSVDQIIHLVEGTNFSALGITGLAFLVLTAILLLANIEKSFNRVWGVHKSRSTARQIMNYTSLLVLVPLLLGVGGTLRARVVIGPILGIDPNVWIQGIASFSVLWIAFALLYTFVPNTRVHFKPAVAGSLVTTFVFVGWMKMFMVMQLGISRNNKIYGAFAALPVFMFWMYVTWVILLLGAEFTFALQNADTYSLESRADNSSMRARVLVALMIIRQAGRAMEYQGEPFQNAPFSRRYKVPIRLVNATVELLIKANYLVRIAGPDEVYVLTRSPEQTNMHQFIGDLMRAGGGAESVEAHLADGSSLKLMLDKLGIGLKEGFGDLTLAKLIEPPDGAAKPAAT